MVKAVRIAVETTTRSDLLCVRCGRFLIGGKGRDLALVVAGEGVDQSHAGLHRRCLRAVRAKIIRRPKPAPAAAP
jgi:hypothetical protein